jgi:DNA modification methylase
MTNTFDIREGDALELLRQMPDESVDACVTDPPYELGFMGKKWDSTGIANSVELWREILRVLKPGAHLLAFGGTRTYHRMVCAIEDAIFEIRDSIQWVYGNGFPKSLDVSKAIDKAAGMEREIVGIHQRENYARSRAGFRNLQGRKPTESRGQIELTAPASDEAKQWAGFGTALKPSHEPIVLARKPLSEKTVAGNVLKWGTGALNVDGCRIEAQAGDYDHWREPDNIAAHSGFEGKSFAMGSRSMPQPHTLGRWPANIIFDEQAAVELDLQSGDLKAGGNLSGNEPSRKTQNCYSEFNGRHEWESYSDEGGASRFFYVAKASTSERGDYNNHPTVKPIELMQYLCRLVTPPQGTVLDIFCGSGSTGIAALREGFGFIGLELNPEYCEMARRRIRDDAPLLNLELAQTA